MADAYLTARSLKRKRAGEQEDVNSNECPAMTPVDTESESESDSDMPPLENVSDFNMVPPEDELRIHADLVDRLVRTLVSMM